MYNTSAKTLFVGLKRIHLPTCQSTQEEMARRVLHSGGALLPEGTLLSTDHQTAGRGQRDLTWESAAGQNLTFSVLFYPRFLRVAEQFALNTALACGLHSALTELLGPEPPQALRLKWPNDLYYDHHKLAGMLLTSASRSMYLEHTIAGIGLNVNQTQFAAPRAQSLAQLTGQSHALDDVLASLCRHLEAHYLWLRQGRTDRLRQAYLQRLYKYQEKHLFEDQEGRIFAGEIVGVDTSGRLAVHAGRTVRYFNQKEIIFL